MLSVSDAETWRAVARRRYAPSGVACEPDDAFGEPYGIDLHAPDFARFEESFGAVTMERPTLLALY